MQDDLNKTDESVRAGGGGTDSTDFVRDRCTSTVTDIEFVIPESPGTDTAANVEVAGSVRRTCAGGVPAWPTEQASATLVVVKTAGG